MPQAPKAPTAPDACAFAFVCAYGDWQIQCSPGVRSDMGGNQEAFVAMMEAHAAHIMADHTDRERLVMRRALQRMGAPASLFEDPELSNGMALGHPVPDRWRDR
jgi:hypothetical protein